MMRNLSMNRMKCIIGVFNSNWSSQTGFIFKQQGIVVNSLLRRFATSNPVSTPSIEVVDVTLSNGLENDKSFIATNNKLTLIQSLSKSGIHRIESTRFLHYKIAPQYIDALDIVTKINPLLIDSNSRSIVSAYVPSLAQLQNAIRHKTKSICISISSTSSFSMHNYKTSVDNHLLVLSDLVSFAKDKDVSVRGRIQCALGCPHEGEVDVERVKELIQKLFKMGCYEVCLEDTIGKGSVESVKMLVEGIKAENEIEISRIGMQLKNRSDGLGLLNALTAYESGIRVFEG
mmetsp:Transcript_6799/g.12168  ORF Transcript_6799/g.12168 Transcript_6799/m.12168 type:complete len:288 (-) Transcript_6799:1044-1907(-)